MIPWQYGKPKFCEISFNGREYVVNATYSIESKDETMGNETAGIDLGEIHIAVVDTGKRVLIANGRYLRSKRRYLNKTNAHFQRKLSGKKKGSRRYKSINRAKKRMQRNINNQTRDILHKQTTKIVRAMKDDGVRTVPI